MQVKTELRGDSFLTQIASNASYIVYGLKGGHVRVLHKETGTLALFKGHSGMVSAMFLCLFPCLDFICLKYPVSQLGLQLQHGRDGQLAGWVGQAQFPWAVSVSRPIYGPTPAGP